MNFSTFFTRALAVLLVLCMMLGMVACGGNTDDQGDKNDDVAETEDKPKKGRKKNDNKES